jgi:hypothetical protein
VFLGLGGALIYIAVILYENVQGKEEAVGAPHA